MIRGTCIETCVIYKRTCYGKPFYGLALAHVLRSWPLYGLAGLSKDWHIHMFTLFRLSTDWLALICIALWGWLWCFPFFFLQQPFCGLVVGWPLETRQSSLSTNWLADSVEDKAPRLPFRAVKIGKD